MKTRLNTILGVVLCVALVAAAVCIGSYRGWSAERSAALNALSADGNMYSLLETRAMDAANLAVVAARHLPADDSDLIDLRGASDAMLSGKATVDELLQADFRLTDVALRFADELPRLPSVQSSKRDKAYISMLTASLGQKTGLSHNYTLLVEDFNQRLTSDLSGRLAMLLGVTPLPALNAE